MAKRSVLSRPLPNASQPRNTFDRSFFCNLNWSSGMILPVFCQFVPVGSSGQINRSIFMRTNAVNTAAFPFMDTHIDFYKVPLKLLMTRYNEFKLNVDDLNSSALYDGGPAASIPSQRVPLSMPFFEFQNVVGDLTSTAVDDLGFEKKQGTRRLFDLLGYNDDYLSWTAAQQSAIATMRLNSFRLQAYQKVYFDHYRNTAYESNNPYAYNADFTYANGNDGEWKLNDVKELFKLRYVNYRKDFFMNLYPSLNYVVSSPSGSDWVLPSSIANLGSGYNSTSGSVIASPSFGVTWQRSASAESGAQILSTQTLRAMFALDRLTRMSAYAPKHVKDQLQSRFGVSMSAASSFESQYLGSFKNDIVIGEVTSTAETTLPLGAIGGRGVGAEPRGKDINFDITGDDGDSIIIGVLYSMVRTVYDSSRLDAFNFKFTREDIFNPEFMDLGLRPITLKEVYTPAGATLAQLNTILGYVPRDQEYKLSIDENHGAFRYLNDGSRGVLSTFTNHANVNMVRRGHTLGTAGVNFTFFKLSPLDLDSVFVYAYTGDDQSFQRDQFFGRITFKFISRQNMSVHGQPRI